MEKWLTTSAKPSTTAPTAAYKSRPSGMLSLPPSVPPSTCCHSLSSSIDPHTRSDATFGGPQSFSHPSLPPSVAPTDKKIIPSHRRRLCWTRSLSPQWQPRPCLSHLLIHTPRSPPPWTHAYHTRSSRSSSMRKTSSPWGSPTFAAASLRARRTL